MKRFPLSALFLTIVFCLAAGTICAQSRERSLEDALVTLAGILADDLAASGARRIAVVEFGDAPGGARGSAGALGRYVALALPAEIRNASRGRFDVVERSAVAVLLKEQEFQFSGVVGETGRARIGSLLASDVLIMGTVEPSGDEALLLDAKAVRVEDGKIVGGFTKRLALVPEVSALVGREVAATTETAIRLSAPATGPFAVRLLGPQGPKTEYRKDNERWILALPGEEYRMELRNDSDRRVGVALLIDGINTAYMKRESPARAVKWVLEPHSTAVVPGWQEDASTARRFVFAGKSESLAAGTGGEAEIGIISASFYPEELSSKAGAGQEAGTKAGDSFGQGVRQVSLAFEGLPVQVSVLRYDYRRGLEARGIRVQE